MSSAERDGGAELTRLPLSRAAVELLESLATTDAPPERTVASARERTSRIAAMAQTAAAGTDVSDGAFSGPTGTVRYRRYEPLAEADGAVVYFHGGGWVTGDLDVPDAWCRALALESGCVVVSVDYSLAPEHPFPVAVEEAGAAVDWVAAELPGPLVIGGDSSGANLAAVIARRARDGGGPRICLQLLVYPVTDAAMQTTAYREHAAVAGALTAAAMEWYFGHYLSDAGAGADPDVSPLRAAALDELPPAHIVVAEHDPLRDDGLGYAEALASAGVAVEVDYHGDMFHGFCTFVGRLEAADRALSDAARAVREAVRREQLIEGRREPQDSSSNVSRTRGST